MSYINDLENVKERLRVACNRYLASEDKLPVTCTLNDIADVFDEYDEYSYMNAFLNSIEVFPDKDYSINDTEGHIKGIRDYAFYKNSALKSVFLPALENFTGITDCDNLETIIVKSASSRTNTYAYINLPKIKKIIDVGGVWNAQGYYAFGNLASIEHISIPQTIFMARRFVDGCPNLKTFICYDYPNNENVNFTYRGACYVQAIIILNQTSVSTLSSTNELLGRNMPNAVIYVPSALQSSYASATNWTAVNAARTILQIESNINSLRELGADFSYTPYANKKWENGALVTDSTIGEEVDS